MAGVVWGPVGFNLDGLPPGQEQSWVWFGVDFWFKVVTITAHALNQIGGGEARVAVVSVESIADPDGTRTIRFTVRNTGGSVANYGVFMAWIQP